MATARFARRRLPSSAAVLLLLLLLAAAPPPAHSLLPDSQYKTHFFSLVRSLSDSSLVRLLSDSSLVRSLSDSSLVRSLSDSQYKTHFFSLVRSLSESQYKILFSLLPDSQYKTLFLSLAQSLLPYSQYKTLFLSLAHSLLPDSQYKTLFFSLAHSLPYSQYKALFSLARSLAARVASLRDARGDLAGAKRAQAIAELSELLGLVEDFARAESNAKRASCIVRNYENAVSVSKLVFARLLRVFRKSGPLREMVETLQKEVVDGDFLRDCLELGSNDLKGLVQFLKDLTSKYYSSSDHQQDL